MCLWWWRTYTVMVVVVGILVSTYCPWGGKDEYIWIGFRCRREQENEELWQNPSHNLFTIPDMNCTVQDSNFSFIISFQFCMRVQNVIHYTHSQLGCASHAACIFFTYVLLSFFSRTITLLYNSYMGLRRLDDVDASVMCTWVESVCVTWVSSPNTSYLTSVLTHPDHHSSIPSLRRQTWRRASGRDDRGFSLWRISFMGMLYLDGHPERER